MRGGVLNALDVGYLLCLALVVIEALRSLPIYASWPAEAAAPLVVVLGVNMVMAGVALQPILYKWLVFGRSSPRELRSDTTMTLFAFTQNLQALMFHLFHPLFGGLFPMNLYHRCLGAHVDLTTTLINEGAWMDPGDGELISVHAWAVLDSGASINGHIVRREAMSQGPIVIHERAVVHPQACKLFGSVGPGACLLPLTTVLRVDRHDPEHVLEDGVFVGCPGEHVAVKPLPASAGVSCGDPGLIV